MRKLLPLLIFLLAAPTYGGSLDSVVQREARELSLFSLTSHSRETFLDLPWDKPSFQFWLSYYRNRWNRVKLLSQVDSYLSLIHI